jgi:hypothetical protein
MGAFIDGIMREVGVSEIGLLRFLASIVTVIVAGSVGSLLGTMPWCFDARMRVAERLKTFASRHRPRADNVAFGHRARPGSFSPQRKHEISPVATGVACQIIVGYLYRVAVFKAWPQGRRFDPSNSNL